MIKYILIAVIVIAVVFVMGAIRSNLQLRKNYRGLEALQWLKGNRNPYALASNHFVTNKAAIDFVEKMYSEGVEFVKIAERCIRDDLKTIKEEGGPYADGLIVKLSSDMVKRKNVLTLCKNELDPEFKDSLEKDIRFDMIFLWWD